MAKNTDPNYYLKYSFQSAETLNNIALNQTERSVQSVGLWKDASAQSRLVANSCKVLKEVHLDSEVKLVSLVTQGQTKTESDEYKDLVVKAGIHTSEVASSFTDFGTGNSHNLSSGDIKFSSYNWGANANIVSLEGGYGNLSFKQIVSVSAYNHLITDLQQTSAQFIFSRAEKQQTLMANTRVDYSDNTYLCFAANSERRVSNEDVYSDAIRIQVGQLPKEEDKEQKTELLHKVNSKVDSSKYGSYLLGTTKLISLHSKEIVKIRSDVAINIQSTNINVLSKNLTNLSSNLGTNISSKSYANLAAAAEVSISGSVVFINSRPPAIIYEPDESIAFEYNNYESVTDTVKTYVKNSLPKTDKAAGVSNLGITIPLPPAGTAGPVTGTITSPKSTPRENTIEETQEPTSIRPPIATDNPYA